MEIIPNKTQYSPETMIPCNENIANISKNFNQINDSIITEKQEFTKFDLQGNTKIDESVRLATVGNVDSGKSTLVGVLTKGLYDDGRGSARVRVFNYPHEMQRGQTSSIAHEIMGFDKSGNQVFPERFIQNKNKYWADVVSKSEKVHTLIDLCGHEKYLKTTMFGMTGSYPDYTICVVGANSGLTKMTREHIGICLALKIPFCVVVTKIDMTPNEITANTMQQLNKVLKSKYVNKTPYMCETESDVQFLVDGIYNDIVCPMFKISSVTGEGLECLRKFIYNLKSRSDKNPAIGTTSDPVEFLIHEKFIVKGVGLIVSGLVTSGVIKKNMNLLLGPDSTGEFKPVIVKEIHINRTGVDQISRPYAGALNIKPLNKKEVLGVNDLRKGVCLIDPKLKPKPIYRMDAEIQVLNHSTTISPGYQAVLHCGVIRQAVNLDSMNKEVLRNGVKGLVSLSFMYSPEYIKPGLQIMLREGRTKVVGKVLKVYDSKEK